ncbi:tetratricopeptide repeat protein [Corallincola platygyrae]|uniref:Tetratricopeptide repeat protein n=1 Tax=Corallincola platygyrae TaxID=1193278 RepID=A0ABW4XR00_9GAMM
MHIKPRLLPVRSTLWLSLIAILVLSGCAQLTEPSPEASQEVSSEEEMTTSPAQVEDEAPETGSADEVIDVADESGVPVEGEQVTTDGEPTPPAKLPNPYLASEPVLSAQVQAQFEAALTTAKSATDEASRQQAIEAFEALLNEQSNLSGARVNLAQLYRQQGQSETAIKQLEQAVEDNPNNLAGWNLLGILQREQGDFAAAEKSYQQALDRWNDYAPAHLNLGILYELYMGRLAEALSHYQAYQALQDEPERRVKGWIRLIERRLPAEQKDGEGA